MPGQICASATEGRLGLHPSRSFAEILKSQVQPRVVTQLQLFTTKDKDRYLTQGKFVERQNQARGLLAINLNLTGAKVGENPVDKPIKMVVGGGDKREQCSKVDTKLGEQPPAEKRKCTPVSFSLNSKSNDIGKRSDLRRSCWIGSGLIVQVDVKGRRRVSWDSNKGGVKSFKWVTRACKDLGKGLLGFGSNELVAQQALSSLGPRPFNPYTCETGECSNTSVGPFVFVDIHKRARESPLEIPTNSSLADPSPPKPEVLLSVVAMLSTALPVENHALATALGVDDGELVVGQSEMLGSLAKPLAVARSSASDGFSAEESLLDPDGVYEKSASQSESAGCLGALSLEEVGIGLFLT